VINDLAKALDVKVSELLGEEQAAFIEQKIGDMTKTEFEVFFLELIKKALKR
jgi:DNA-binding ferritin-like protein (Dps family)